jgi:phage terminase large subunit-like protein
MVMIVDIWRKAVEPAMEPNCQLFLLGTPFTPDDIYVVLESDDRYFFIRIPIWDEDHVPAWVERYPKDMIERIERNIDAMTFAQQYLVLPMHPGGMEFKVAWLMPYVEVPLNDINRARYVTCDLAVSESKKADYSGISDWYHRHDKWFLNDAWAPKGIDATGRKLLELDADPDVKIIMIEAPGTLHQMCQKDPNFRNLRKAVYVTGVWGTKVERVGTLEPWFRNGYVYVKMKSNGAPANAPFFWREYTAYNRKQPPKDLHILDGFQMLIEEYGGHQGVKYHKRRRY